MMIKKRGMVTVAATCFALGLLVQSLGVQAQPAPISPLADGEKLTSLARDFLLDGPTLYKVGRRSHNLIVEDINGNGNPEILVFNNDRSVIEILRRTENQDDPLAGFEKEEFPLDRPVRASLAMDVNGNGRMDLVIAGAPPRLSILYQDENGRLQDPIDTDIQASRLMKGDLTGDGRDDLLVFHNGRFTLLPSKTRGINLTPSQIFHTTSDPSSNPMLLDFDGDGRLDIVYQDSRRLGDLIIRLQSPEGTFPTEFRESTGVLRHVTAYHAQIGRAHV